MMRNKTQLGDTMINAKLTKELKALSSLAELNAVSSLVNDLKTQLGKATIVAGAKVYVVQKTKKTLGTVVKVKIKRATVDLPDGRYSVPLGMLEAA
tara:strand:+ start:2854 stop:3141 length:288 start_codon:yes stop_codon:yes gene_type:complete